MGFESWAGDVFQVVFGGVSVAHDDDTQPDVSGVVCVVYYVEPVEDAAPRVRGEATFTPGQQGKVRADRREGVRVRALDEDGTFAFGHQTYRVAIPAAGNGLTMCHLQRVDWVSVKMAGPQKIKKGTKRG